MGRMNLNVCSVCIIIDKRPCFGKVSFRATLKTAAAHCTFKGRFYDIYREP